jgi:hypothetical protein
MQDMSEHGSYQTAQIKYTSRGYQHRSDPDDYLPKEVNPKEKKTQQSYCKLSPKKKEALKNHIIDDLRNLYCNVPEVFRRLPRDLIADTKGNVMSEATFMRVFDNFRIEVTGKKEAMKAKALELHKHGFDVLQIAERLRRQISRQHLYQIMAEIGLEKPKTKTQRIAEMLRSGMDRKDIGKFDPDLSQKLIGEVMCKIKRGDI